MMYDGYWFGVGIMWSFMILFVVLIVWMFKPKGDCSHQEKSAMEILCERYAQDEINSEEFEQKRKDLREAEESLRKNGM